MTRWRIHLTRAAEDDLQAILRYTTEQFGASQSKVYRETILAAMSELNRGPLVAGSKSFEKIRPGLRALHVARHRRRGRHRLIYSARAEHVIEILRILHDAMDLPRHVPAAGRRPGAK